MRIPVSNTRYLKLTAILLLSPLYFFAQTLTGLWTGALTNDSNSARKEQSFEIALSEYKGKVTGYSCSEFIVNDTLYYIVKRVKGTIEGDLCEVSDDEIVAYNFRGKLDKGVKVTSTFRRNKADSTWYLDGTWKTNATKKYYAVTGKVSLSEEKDLSLSKVFPHLEELNLANEMAFYQERKQDPVIARLAKPERIVSGNSNRPSLSYSNSGINIENPGLQKAEPDASVISAAQADSIAAGINKPANDLAKTKTSRPDQNSNHTPVLAPPTVQRAEADASVTGAVQADVIAAGINKPTGDLSKTKTNSPSSANTVSPALNKPALSRAETDATVVAAVQAETIMKKMEKPGNDLTKTTTKPVNTSDKNQKPAVANNTSKPAVNIPVNNSAVTANNVYNKDPKQAAISPAVLPAEKMPEPVTAAAPVVKKTDAEVAASGAVIAERKSEFSQVVSFSSDSLVLALYDNGEIDGDTVSIYMNGQPLMMKQGLKASAIKKTIYINGETEDFNLVLYADNLGKYPPNTGLLVVKDGEDTYNLRFSSDLQKSSGIVFRKKKQ